MYDALIKLNSIKDLYSFVDILDKHSGTFEIVANDYVVDARSLMSMLSLDLSKPLELSFDSVMRLLLYCLSFSHLFYVNDLCRINGFFH